MESQGRVGLEMFSTLHRIHNSLPIEFLLSMDSYILDFPLNSEHYEIFGSFGI